MGIIGDLMTRYREAILYVFFGGLTTLVNYGAYAAFAWLNINPNICNILSWVVSVTFAFLVNKWYVFESKNLDRATVWKEATEFFGARVFTLLVSVVLFYTMYDIMGLDWGITLFCEDFLGFGEGFFTKIVGSIIEIALNWILSKYWVFRKAKASE